MDYQRIYESLIGRAKNRKLSGYSEIHHILPKCLGGKDTVENLVALTASEHFLAHQLLVKIYPGNQRLHLALHMMTVSTNKTERLNNKSFAWIRELTAKAQIGTVFTEDRKQKIREKAQNRILTDEHKKNIGKSSEGRFFSEESRRQKSITLKQTKAENKEKRQRPCPGCGKQLDPCNHDRHINVCYEFYKKLINNLYEE